MKAICIKDHNGRFGEYTAGQMYEFTEYDIRPMSAVARGILRIEKDPELELELPPTAEELELLALLELSHEDWDAIASLAAPEWGTEADWAIALGVPDSLSPAPAVETVDVGTVTVGENATETAPESAEQASSPKAPVIPVKPRSRGKK